MAITESGIDPVRVLNLIDEVVTYSNRMDIIFSYLEGNLRRELDNAYGGVAADALLARTVQLANNARNQKAALISKLKLNMQRDLEDTQKTDELLSTQ